MNRLRCAVLRRESRAATKEEKKQSDKPPLSFSAMDSAEYAAFTSRISWWKKGTVSSCVHATPTRVCSRQQYLTASLPLLHTLPPACSDSSQPLNPACGGCGCFARPCRRFQSQTCNDCRLLCSPCTTSCRLCCDFCSSSSSSSSLRRAHRLCCFLTCFSILATRNEGG
jgi:hypothetical protein